MRITRVDYYTLKGGRAQLIAHFHADAEPLRVPGVGEEVEIDGNVFKVTMVRNTLKDLTVRVWLEYVGR